MSTSQSEDENSIRSGSETGYWRQTTKTHVIQMNEIENDDIMAGLDHLEKKSGDIMFMPVEAPDKSEKGCCAPLAFIPELALCMQKK
jgi:hypothetical protein